MEGDLVVMSCDDPVYAAVGQVIRQQRENMKMTQADFAKRLGLTRTSVTNIERGRQRFGLDTLYVISTILEIPVHALLPPSGAGPRKDLQNPLPKNLHPNETAWALKILGE